MTRVGILTFHNAVNYGASLQAYALQETVKALGYDVAVADYRCPLVTRRGQAFVPGARTFLRDPANAWRTFCSRAAKRRKGEAFEPFTRQCLLLSAPLANEKGIADAFDIVVVGSDQVWNLGCTGGDLTFFLGGSDCKDLKKVAYAASFGSAVFPDKYADRCGDALRGFSALGIREQSGKEIAERLSGKLAKVVLDPTLLPEREFWERLAGKRIVNEEYVLVHSMEAHGETLRKAHALAQNRGLKLAVVGRYADQGSRMDGIDFYSVGPIEYLSLLKYASTVVTSSFHGLALSLALGIDVRYSLTDEGQNVSTRLTSLVDIAGIEGQEIVAGEDLPPLDYELVDDRIAAERRASLLFLQESLAACC